MDLMTELAEGSSSLKITVLAGQAYLCARITWHARAIHPNGLLAFASFLLLLNLATAVSYVSMAPFIGEPVLPHLLVISVFQIAGLGALAKVTP